MAAHRQRAVAGVDEVHRGPHDGAQGFVQVQTSGDREHGLDEAVHPIARTDHHFDPIGDLAEQAAQHLPRHRLVSRIAAAPTVVRHRSTPYSQLLE
ncbi:hypothetical protein [Nocardia salmonicida]|uniref:hypothetical protein n=1 Tax=Nocardia salmonicida TaxID=53431 RepID=UPI00368689CC